MDAKTNSCYLDGTMSDYATELLGTWESRAQRRARNERRDALKVQNNREMAKYEWHVSRDKRRDAEQIVAENPTEAALARLEHCRKVEVGYQTLAEELGCRPLPEKRHEPLPIPPEVQAFINLT